MSRSEWLGTFGPDEPHTDATGIAVYARCRDGAVISCCRISRQVKLECRSLLKKGGKTFDVFGPSAPPEEPAYTYAYEGDADDRESMMLDGKNDRANGNQDNEAHKKNGRHACVCIELPAQLLREADCNPSRESGKQERWQ